MTTWFWINVGITAVLGLLAWYSHTTSEGGDGAMGNAFIVLGAVAIIAALWIAYGIGLLIKMIWFV